MVMILSTSLNVIGIDFDETNQMHGFLCHLMISFPFIEITCATT